MLQFWRDSFLGVVAEGGCHGALRSDGFRVIGDPAVAAEQAAHDGCSADDMLASVRAGCVLFADRAYDSDALRKTLHERGAWANVRVMPQRREPPAISPFLYRYRNTVERFFNKPRHFRAVATRYDLRDDNYIASITLAPIRIWLRHNESMA